jgi:hypothetical protein
MDSSVMREFLASGRTLITDTMSPKSILPKAPKNVKVEPVSNLNPLENLLKRVVDEKVSKKDLIEVFHKIIDEKEKEI